MTKLFAFQCKLTGEVKLYTPSRRLDPIWLWFHNIREVPAYAINVKSKPAAPRLIGEVASPLGAIGQRAEGDQHGGAGGAIRSAGNAVPKRKRSRNGD